MVQIIIPAVFDQIVSSHNYLTAESADDKIWGKPIKIKDTIVVFPNQFMIYKTNCKFSTNWCILCPKSNDSSTQSIKLFTHLTPNMIVRGFYSLSSKTS